MTAAETTGGAPTRRAVLTGACVCALAACSTYSSGGNAPVTTGAAPGVALARTQDIPVGGGKVFPDAHVVVTQPAPQQFKGFSATCTHQGCTVNEVAGGTINCPCHGSRFSISDGSPTAGPAQTPLPARPVMVNGNTITAG